MTRINVYSTDEDTRESTLAGWFNPDTSEQFTEPKYWDGNNHRGVISGLQIGHECVYRTKGGRWVLHHDGTCEFNGPEYYRFLSDEQAQDWLLRAELDDAVAKFFGELEEEKGPGRPEIGPALKIRLGEELTVKVDAARGHGESRAAAVRRLLEQALA